MCVCVYFILSLRVFRAALFTRVNTCSLAERERVLEISDDERERGFVLKPFRVCKKKTSQVVKKVVLCLSFLSLYQWCSIRLCRVVFLW